MENFEYYEPCSIEELQKLLQDHRGWAKVMAGGTDLLIAMKQHRVIPSVVINLKRISGLNYIRQNNDAVEIGACTTLRELEKSDLLNNSFLIVPKAASGIASYQLRNKGTVGGNLCLDTRCWYANQSRFWRKSYPDCRKSGGNECYIFRRGDKCHALWSGDLAPVLIALDAEVTILGPAGRKTFPLASLYSGDGSKPVNLQEDEFILSVQIPRSERILGSFIKFSKRKAVEFALASVALVVKLAGGTQKVESARAVFGSLSSKPLQVSKLEEMINGSDITEVDAYEAGKLAVDAIHLTSSSYAPVWYKQRVIETIVVQVIDDVKQQVLAVGGV